MVLFIGLKGACVWAYETKHVCVMCYVMPVSPPRGRKESPSNDSPPPSCHMYARQLVPSLHRFPTLSLFNTTPPHNNFQQVTDSWIITILE